MSGQDTASHPPNSVTPIVRQPAFDVKRGRRANNTTENFSVSDSCATSLLNAGAHHWLEGVFL
jgi:hypothetical protein